MKISRSHWMVGLIAATGMAMSSSVYAQDAGSDLGPGDGGVVESAANAVSEGAEQTGNAVGQAADAAAEAPQQVAPPETPDTPATPEQPGLTESIEGSVDAEAQPMLDANKPDPQPGDAPMQLDADANINADADVNATPNANAEAGVDAQMRDRNGRDRGDRNRDGDWNRGDRDRDRGDRNRGDRDDRNARWRFKQHNGAWWYWTPSNNWMVYRNGSWARYNGPGYGHGGQWYDNYQPRTTTGYRGSPYRDGYYYRDNDGMRFYYNQGRRYYYDNGGRYYMGPNGGRTYDRRFADPDTARGASAGAAIGGAIGGRDGANIGAGIGAAIGAGSR